MNNALLQFALNRIASNPGIANNPQNQELIAVLQSGDSVKGEQVAKSICEAHGMDQETAVKRAESFFGFKL